MPQDYNEILSKVSLPSKRAFGQYLTLILDAEGGILHVREGKSETRYPSLIDELRAAKNIRELFDIPPGGSLGELKEFQAAGAANAYAIFYNRKNIQLLEEADLFYTSLVSILCSLFRIDSRYFCGIIRVLDSAPNISFSRVGGILYVDDQENLVGFNRNLYLSFSKSYSGPNRMLGKPVSSFLSPTPSEIQHRQLLQTKIPEPGRFKEIYHRNFPGDRGLEDLIFTGAQHASITGEGLRCVNPTDEILFLFLPVTMDSRMTFHVILEADAIEGEPPALIFGPKRDGSAFAGLYPDDEGYFFGTDASRQRYTMKRSGFIHCFGSPVSVQTRATIELYKVSQSFRLLNNGREILAYHDADFLHHAKAIVAIGFRQRSACVLKGVSVSSADEKEAGAIPETPIVRLKGENRGYFILNRINGLFLATNYPTVSAYLLENVTETKQRSDRFERENKKLVLEMEKYHEGFIGQSREITEIKKKAALVAASDATVLIQGETGTGKEVLAQFIHTISPRKDGPFIKVDCSTLPQSLMESELFGHEKGAFTGAVQRRLGSLERADKGTLFIDEVGNVLPGVQVKLLQFLQDFTLTRLGGERAIKIDVRIIVATNAPLRERVEQGLFRADLYYRMDVVSIRLPPLRERRDDIHHLCIYFLTLFNSIHNRAIKDLSPEAYEKIFSHDWPGNIRELKNTIERAVLFCRNETIDGDSITLSEEKVAKKGRAFRIVNVGLPQIKDLLERHHGNAKMVAKELSISRRALYYKIKQAGGAIGMLRADLKSSQSKPALVQTQ